MTQLDEELREIWKEKEEKEYFEGLEEYYIEGFEKCGTKFCDSDCVFYKNCSNPLKKHFQDM